MVTTMKVGMMFSGSYSPIDFLDDDSNTIIDRLSAEIWKENHH